MSASPLSQPLGVVCLAIFPHPLFFSSGASLVADLIGCRKGGVWPKGIKGGVGVDSQWVVRGMQATWGVQERQTLREELD